MSLSRHSSRWKKRWLGEAPVAHARWILVQRHAFSPRALGGVHRWPCSFAIRRPRTRTILLLVSSISRDTASVLGLEERETVEEALAALVGAYPGGTVCYISHSVWFDRPERGGIDPQVQEGAQRSL